jgi:hypothetical protein
MKMDFSELSTTVKAALYERISNPVFGCFILSWLIVNYRILFVLFSSTPYADKFSYIDESIIGLPGLAEYISSKIEIDVHGCLWFIGWLFRGLLLPGYMTYLFIWKLPYVLLIAYEKSLETTKQLREKKNAIEAATVLTEADRHRLLNVMAEQEKNYRVRLNQLTLDLDAAKQELAIKVQEIERLVSNVNNEKTEAHKNERSVTGGQIISNKSTDAHSQKTNQETAPLDDYPLPDHKKNLSDNFNKLNTVLRLSEKELASKQVMTEALLSIFMACMLYVNRGIRKSNLLLLFIKMTHASPTQFDEIFEEALKRDYIRQEDNTCYLPNDLHISNHEYDKLEKLSSVIGQIEES